MIRRDMKRNNVKILLAFSVALLLLVANAWAIILDELTKEWKQSFEVNQDATVEIHNKYGKVHVTTWDQNKVDIKVVAYVDVNDAETGKKLLDEIDVTMTGTADHVKAVTDINCKLTGKNCNKLKIDYTISMPKDNNLVIKNKFGDVFVDALNGNSDLEISYGNMTCNQKKKKSNVVDVAFGKATLEDITSCKLNARYSDVNIGKADHLDADTHYSGLVITKATTIYNVSEYDKLVQIDACDDAHVDCSFSSHRIGKVNDKLNLKVNYGSCEVKEIPRDFKQVDIDCRYGSTVIYFDEDASFNFTGSCSMGGLDFPRNATNLTKESKGSTDYQVAGKVGNATNPKANVSVSECKYGSVKLKFK